MGTWKLCQQSAMFGLRIPKYRDKRFINKRKVIEQVNANALAA
ncbi:MAG: hypothetical protein ACLUOR_04380 [Coprococcus sp.]